MLPLTHLKWLPDLGTTRPLSSILFALAFGLIVLSSVFQSRLTWKSLTGWEFYKNDLSQTPGWEFLRWWGILVLLGIGSSIITVFYGNVFQALNRLLGYVLIFVFIYIAIYSLLRFGIETIAFWTGLGYVPVLFYGIIEALSILKMTWAYAVVSLVRTWVIVDFNWVGRLALLATEPSFVSFQLLLLITLFPFLKNRYLRISTLALIFLAAVFSLSGTIILVLSGYVVSLILFSLPQKKFWQTSTAGGFAAVLAGLAYSLSPAIRLSVSNGIQRAMQIARINDMVTSMTIRFSYVLNLIYALIETRGVGLGMGQYGMYWKEIYLRHIDYRAFDKFGEIAKALASPTYMRPWSVIFGIGADLGIVGLVLFSLFIYQVFRLCRDPRAKAVVVASLVAFVGAYPIVTPHIWLALGLVGVYGYKTRQDQAV